MRWCLGLLEVDTSKRESWRWRVARGRWLRRTGTGKRWARKNPNEKQSFHERFKGK